MSVGAESPEERQARLARLITEHGAVLHGHFRLASRRHSDTYVEKFRVLERPWVLAQVAKSIVDAFAGAAPEVVAGPSTGGIIVAYEVARQLGVPAIYVELGESGRTLRRGGYIEPGKRVLLVDDVLTTGTSLQEVRPVIERAGGNLIGVGVLIDRSEKSPDFGVPLHAATRFEAVSYADEELPEWLAAIPITTPGTRAQQTPIH